MNTEIMIEKIFELPDMEFTEIYDTSSVMNVDKIDNSSQGLNLSGICSVSILGMTNNGIDSASFTVNFSQLFPEITDQSIKDCTVTPIQAVSSISGRNMISIRISANASIKMYENKNQKVLSDFSVISQREERNNSCITIYYPSKTDTLWDISKEYGISPKDIANENKLSFSSDGNLSENVKTIFIP